MSIFIIGFRISTNIWYTFGFDINNISPLGVFIIDFRILGIFIIDFRISTRAIHKVIIEVVPKVHVIHT